MTKIFRILGTELIIFALCLMLVGCHHSGLSIKITSPYDGARVYATPIVVNGTVSNPSAKVIVNSTPMVVAENGYFTGGVDIIEGENIITIVATMEGQTTVTKSITVIYISGG